MKEEKQKQQHKKKNNVKLNSMWQSQGAKNMKKGPNVECFFFLLNFLFNRIKVIRMENRLTMSQLLCFMKRDFGDSNRWFGWMRNDILHFRLQSSSYLFKKIIVASNIWPNEMIREGTKQNKKNWSKAAENVAWNFGKQKPILYILSFRFHVIHHLWYGVWCVFYSLWR